MSAIIKKTRTQIFNDIWENGLEKTSENYTVSLNELIEVCKSRSIPMPDESEYFFGVPEKINKPSLPSSDNEMVELTCVWKRRKKIDSPLGSKANALLVLQVLEDESDENKWISVNDINNALEKHPIHNAKLDRKTIYPIIDLLQELGYDIQVKKEGGKNYYSLWNKTLDAPEARIMIDSLKMNPLISKKTRDELCNKVIQNLAKKKSNDRIWHWSKFNPRIENYAENDNLYELFDSIEEAIEQNLKLSFNYARYNTFGKKVIDENELHIVSPLYIRLRNFTYYLFCSENDGDTSAEYRFDRIENLTIIDETNEVKRLREKYKIVGNAMTRSPLVNVTLQCENDLIDKISDDFPTSIKNITFSKNDDENKFNMTFLTNTAFIVDWAASVADKCEVIEPQKVRDMVINKLKNNKYGV